MQILSRFTWELPQTILGLEYSKLMNALYKLDFVEYYDGATFVVRKGASENGITLGSYINIKSTTPKPVNNYHNFDPSQNQLFMHEYGHYLQSQEYGWAYLFSVGVPSIISAAKSKQVWWYDSKLGSYIEVSSHRIKWYERHASKKGYDYFKKKNEYLYWDEHEYPF